MIQVHIVYVYLHPLQSFSIHHDKAIIIGLGYEFQLINDEFGEPHDLKFDLVFTEQGFHIY